MYLSIIIPAYNEERRLEKTLIRIDGYLSLQKYDYEILVVNDGSRDKTLQIAETLSKKIKNLKIIDNEKNRGKGFAVRQGLLTAIGEYRLFTDADNSVSISQIENFFPYFKQNYDILIASRDVKGSVLSPAQPWQRRALGHIFNLIFKMFIGIKGIKDSQCGFKIFTKKSIEDILPRCRINRWSFDAEILAIAQKLGYRIKEVPVIWKNDKNSRVNFIGMAGALKDLIKIKINLLSGKDEKISKK